MFFITANIPAFKMTPKKEPEPQTTTAETAPGVAYRWWYFDALSDNGRDALIIAFFDNYIFSPRYNSSSEPGIKHPAIAFSYFRDGRLKYRTVEEVVPGDFELWKDGEYCRVGRNSFSHNLAPYGSGYAITIDAPLGTSRRIEASIEWLTVEFGGSSSFRQGHKWNLTSSRSDVTGKITIRGRSGKIKDVVNFRGSGCCESESDPRSLAETTSGWQWGRAHFADSTAIYCRTLDEAGLEARCDLYVVKDGELHEMRPDCQEDNIRRNLYLNKYPRRLIFTAKDGTRLKVKQLHPIESNFFYVRFLSEMTLNLRDGKPRKTIGISEQFSAKALNYKWLRWISR